MNIFSSDPLQEYIEQQIIVAWDHLRSDTENFPAFFNSFHMVRLTKTLVILKEQIDQTSPQSFDIHSIVFDKHNGEKISATTSLKYYAALRTIHSFRKPLIYYYSTIKSGQIYLSKYIL